MYDDGCQLLIAVVECVHDSESASYLVLASARAAQRCAGRMESRPLIGPKEKRETKVESMFSDSKSNKPLEITNN